MKPIALALLLPAVATTVHADSSELSWEFVENRTRQAEEVLEHQPEIEAIAERERARQAEPKGPNPTKAYADLSNALAKHPQMAEVNRKESEATKAYQSAVNGGNPVEISITQQAYAKAKAARTQKALSIPELKLAIETWQKAVVDEKEAKEDEAETRQALEAIQSKLKALSEVIGR
ncbi:MAG: hypothetical protein AAGI48_12025 [Verrucomicrobiota bacterium]